MLYIKYRYTDKVQEWHLGEDLSLNEPTTEIEVIQADGHELNEILRQFEQTIPRSRTRSQQWYGDIAKCIIANLDTGR